MQKTLKMLKKRFKLISIGLGEFSINFSVLQLQADLWNWGWLHGLGCGGWGEFFIRNICRSSDSSHHKLTLKLISYTHTQSLFLRFRDNAYVKAWNVLGKQICWGVFLNIFSQLMCLFLYQTSYIIFPNISIDDCIFGERKNMAGKGG